MSWLHYSSGFMAGVRDYLGPLALSSEVPSWYSPGLTQLIPDLPHVHVSDVEWRTTPLDLPPVDDFGE